MLIAKPCTDLGTGRQVLSTIQTVSFQLSTDGRTVYSKIPGDLTLAQPLFFQSFDLVSLHHGQLCITHLSLLILPDNSTYSITADLFFIRYFFIFSCCTLNLNWHNMTFKFFKTSLYLQFLHIINYVNFSLCF